MAPPQHRPFPSVSFSDGTLCVWLVGPAVLRVVGLLTDSWGPVLGHRLHITIHTGLAPASESGQKRVSETTQKLILSHRDTSSQTLIILMFAFSFSVSLLDFLKSLMNMAQN